MNKEIKDNTEPNHSSVGGVTTSGWSKKEILYGSLLGDGYLFGDKKYTKRFGFFQTKRKKEYVLFLKKILSYNFNKEIKLIKKPVTKRWNGKSQYGFQIRDKYFNHLQKIFYPKGKKRVTQKILSALTPLSLALWYMDDGSLATAKYSKNQKGEQVWGARWIVLCTHSFTLKENKMIQKYFKDYWDINWNVYKGRYGWYLKAYIGEGMKFFEIIYPYIVPCMLYKIDTKYSINNSRSPHKARHDKIMKIWSELWSDPKKQSTDCS